MRACVHARVKHSWVPRFPSPTSSLLLLKCVATLQVALCIFTCAHGEECRCLSPRGRYLKSIDASGQDQSLSQAPQRAAFSRANVDTGGGSHSAWLQPRAARQAPRVCHKAGFDAGGAVRRSEGGRARSAPRENDRAFPPGDAADAARLADAMHMWRQQQSRPQKAICRVSN